MTKKLHEVRDPIHVFVRLTSDEREVLNSRAFQRLRYIHQLALTYLVYPGATHRRFEHSLGVMELATRIFDVVTDKANVAENVRELLPEVDDDFKRTYWRQVLRVAALCHDMGHLPFSHAAEKDLLPPGVTHEDLTRKIVLDDELGGILDNLKIQRTDVVKLALGPDKAPDLTFSTWETILAEIIVGDAFGADRMDYLLRDSHHAGVAYGRFDHFRLIDTLRILPSPPSGTAKPAVEEATAPAAAPAGPASQSEAPCEDKTDASANASDPAPAQESEDDSDEPALGILDGGLHSAEALMIARFFMFSQLYFHPVRRIYDIHLKDFLLQTLSDGKYASSVNEHLEMTDNEVTASIMRASRTNGSPGHDPARRIAKREHFKLFYSRHPADLKINLQPGKAVYEAAKAEFGEENVRWDHQPAKGRAPDFPVSPKEGPITSSMAMSDPLNHLPAASFDYVFVNPSLRKKAQTWLDSNRKEILSPTEDSEHGAA
jgi:HD superfamily phosphohydrolase